MRVLLSKPLTAIWEDCRLESSSCGDKRDPQEALWLGPMTAPTGNLWLQKTDSYSECVEGGQLLTDGLFGWGQETQAYVMEAAHFPREGVQAKLSFKLPPEYAWSLELLLPRPPASSI